MSEPVPSELVEAEIDRVLTQYRESPNLLFMMRTYLQHVADLAPLNYQMPDAFHLDTAVGEQLTFIGRRLGWPRCHCVCVAQPVFGFACSTEFSTSQPVVGFCEGGTWANCGDIGIGDLCIDDDELYRKFLQSRLYQIRTLYDFDSLTAAIRIFFGDAATILDQGKGRVVIAPGRELTENENAYLQLIPRVLPIAPGIRVRFHFGTELNVFGFGDGWGGFCEPYAPDGLPIGTEDGSYLVTEDDEILITGPLTQGSPWMCEIDPRPYDCV